MGKCLSWKYFSLLLSLLFFHSQFPVSSSLSSNSQCSVLLHFNHSLSLNEDAFTPPSYYYSSNIQMCENSYPKTGSWKEDKDCCAWDGVVCDNSTRHVIALDLSCSWLYGFIDSNSTLFLLRHLRSLNLAGNFFRYSLISPEFGNFQSLTHLNLSNSFFNGQIPYEISQLSSLVSLDLSSNFLSIKTPVWKRVIGNLTQLRELLLDETDTSSIRPNSLMNLSSSLTTLSLRYCGLQGKLELNMFRLPSMQTLNLGHNENLQGSLPKSNWNSSSLEFLDLSWINFSIKLPDFIGNLKSLKYLNLHGCCFTGEIPTSLGNLVQITFLDLLGNNFTGSIPASLGNLTQITSLDLHYNNFIGSIPTSLGNLTKLTYLDLSSNSFSGEI